MGREMQGREGSGEVGCKGKKQKGDEVEKAAKE